jgi:hypothetical protein
MLFPGLLFLRRHTGRHFPLTIAAALLCFFPVYVAGLYPKYHALNIYTK